MPHLTVGKRGPESKLSLYRSLGYILKFLYIGCQWKELPIEKDESGRPEIHYTRIYSVFRRWESDKKGGENIGYSGHNHMKGDKIVAFCDRNCDVISPFVKAPGNR